jgi:hypothetical protein
MAGLIFRVKFQRTYNRSSQILLIVKCYLHILPAVPRSVFFRHTPIYEKFHNKKRCFSPTIRKICLYIRKVFHINAMEILNNILELISIIVMVVTLAFSLIHRNKRNLFIIQLYIIISLIINVLLKILEYQTEKQISLKYASMLIKIYSIIEFTLLCLFFLRLIKGKKSRNTLKILYSIYVSIFFAISIIFKNAIFLNMSPIYGLENIFIAIPALLYIFEMVKSDDIVDLKSSSEFIAVCGILFYFSVTTPYFFYNHDALRFGLLQLFSLLNTIFYILLFTSFLKAYLCPTQGS